MDRYKIPCTAEQTKKALELGAPIRTIKSIRTKGTILSDDVIEYDENTFTYVTTPTAEQMIGFILEAGRGYSTDLSELIREQGYKQGCLTFIDSCLK